MTALYAILIVAAVSVGIRYRLAKRVRDADRELMDGGFGDQCFVELTIVVDRRRIGADRGVMWFADGLMGFSGRACSFVLAASDLEVGPTASGANGVRPYPADTLVLVGTPRPSYMVVTPLAGQEWYRTRLRTFLQDSEPGEGERCFPPLVPYGEGSLVRSI